MNTQDSKKRIVGFIPCLLRLACPSAIFLTIIAVVINPVYGHSDRDLPHIFQETRKHQPIGTHPNTSGTIAVKSVIPWIRASLNHCCPYPISMGCHTFSSVTVLNKSVVFGRHSIAYFNVVLSGGRPATTGAHCDCFNVNLKEEQG